MGGRDSTEVSKSSDEVRKQTRRHGKSGLRGNFSKITLRKRERSYITSFFFFTSLAAVLDIFTELYTCQIQLESCKIIHFEHMRARIKEYQ